MRGFFKAAELPPVKDDVARIAAEEIMRTVTPHIPRRMVSQAHRHHVAVPLATLLKVWALAEKISERR